MKKEVLWIPLYTILAVLVVLSYISARSYLISTPLGYTIVSNLTLNYALFTFLLGGVAGWFAWARMFKRWKVLYRFISMILSALLIAELWLVLAAFGGYTIKVQSLLGPALLVTFVIWMVVVFVSSWMYRRSVSRLIK